MLVSRRQMYIWKARALILAAATLSAVIGNAAGDIAFDEMERYLEDKGVAGDYTQERYVNMVKLIKELRSRLANEGVLEEPVHVWREKKVRKCAVLLSYKTCDSMIDKVPTRDLSKNERRTIQKALAVAEGKLQNSENRGSEERAYAMLLTRNILYSMFAGRYKDRSMSTGEMADLVLNKGKTHINAVPANHRFKALTHKDAEKEARFLVDPQSSAPDRFLTVADLVGRNHLEIAALDVRDDHHLWYSDRQRAQISHPWQHFEAKVLERANAHLGKKGKIAQGDYSLQDAQRVVFFDKTKPEGGSHPKIKVRDVHGLGWKLKWGDEFFTEAVANYLYLELGGKYQDLNYTHTPANPVLVIFPQHDPKVNLSASEVKAQNGGCGPIYSFSDLEKCIAANLRKVNVENHVWAMKSGLLTNDEIKSLASHVNTNVDLTQWVGHNYALIGEISMELRDGKVLNRLGPMAQSSLGSEDDRAMRGMILMHLWLDNFDAKDSNGESGIFSDEKGKDSFVQSPTDLGAAFRGSVLQGVGINHFDHEKFLRHGFFSSGHFSYHRLLVYRPKTADTATFADTLWMARKIVNLPLRVIREAVAVSQMPDFYQETLVYKLVARQRTIAELYGLENDLDSAAVALKAPTVRISLRTPEEEWDVATKYGVSLGSLRHLKYEAKLGDDYVDVVVEAGRVAKCTHSLLINLLEREVYRSGVTRNPMTARHRPGVCKLSR